MSSYIEQFSICVELTDEIKLKLKNYIIAISAEDVPGLVIYHHGNDSEQGPSLLGFCPNSIYKLDQFPENIVNFFIEESESQFIPTFNKEDFDALEEIDEVIEEEIGDNIDYKIFLEDCFSNTEEFSIESMYGSSDSLYFGNLLQCGGTVQITESVNGQNLKSNKIEIQIESVPVYSKFVDVGDILGQMTLCDIDDNCSITITKDGANNAISIGYRELVNLLKYKDNFCTIMSTMWDVE
jgi:hypothetical protein